MGNIGLIALCYLGSLSSICLLYARSWSSGMLSCICACRLWGGSWRFALMVFPCSWHYWHLFPFRVSFYRRIRMGWTSFTNGLATLLQAGVTLSLFRFSSSWENDTFRIEFRNIVGWYRRYINKNGRALRKIYSRCGVFEYFFHYRWGFIKGSLELYIRWEA